jgi:hypothetical protein
MRYLPKYFICISVLMLVGIAGILSIMPDGAMAIGGGGRGEEIDRAIEQIGDMHNEITPSPWTYELPDHPGWYRWLNPANPEYPAIYPIKEFNGYLWLVVGADWIRLSDIEGVYMWSSEITIFPEYTEGG